MISLIWAMDENHLIGDKNRLPWHYIEDLKYFKSVVNGKIVLMGDLTYQSMKSYFKDKKFPYEKIYVANINYKEYEDAICVTNLDEFLKNIKEDIFILGGRTIYQLSLPYANRLYITYILKAYKGDTYFPKFDLNDFKLISSRNLDELIFAIYERVHK